MECRNTSRQFNSVAVKLSDNNYIFSLHIFMRFRTCSYRHFHPKCLTSLTCQIIQVLGIYFCFTYFCALASHIFLIWTVIKENMFSDMRDFRMTRSANVYVQSELAFASSCLHLYYPVNVFSQTSHALTRPSLNIRRLLMSEARFSQRWTNSLNTAPQGTTALSSQ